MATKKTSTTAEANATASEPVYTAQEYAANAAAIFGAGVSPDIVTAALRVAGVKQTTKSEAISIVKNFRKKEA